MSLFSFSKKLDRVSLVLDIGSGSVGGALVDLSSHTPTILSSLRIPLEIPLTASHDKLFKAFLQTTEEIVRTLIHEGHALHVGRIYSAHCFLSSPWYGSRVIHSTIERPEPVTVTPHFLKDALEGDAEKVTLALNQSEKEHLATTALTILENKILTITLNGYEIANPYGKKARIVETVSYISFSSKELSENLENIIFKYTHTHITQGSFMLGLYSFVKKSFLEEKEYALFDVSGEMTDIAFVSRGSIVRTESIPLGRNAVIRKIAKAFDVGPDLALSFIHLYGEKVMEDGIALRIRELIAEAEQEWNNLFAQILQDPKTLERGHPGRSFIVADLGIGAIWAQFLISGGHIKKEKDAILLQENSLRDVIHVDGIIVDPFLVIETLYIHRES